MDGETIAARSFRRVRDDDAVQGQAQRRPAAGSDTGRLDHAAERRPGEDRVDGGRRSGRLRGGRRRRVAAGRFRRRSAARAAPAAIAIDDRGEAGREPDQRRGAERAIIAPPAAPTKPMKPR